MTDYQFERLLELQIAGKYQKITEEFSFKNFQEALIGLDAFIILGIFERAEFLLEIWREKATTNSQKALIALNEGRILLLKRENDKALNKFEDALEIPNIDKYIEHFIKIRIAETYYYQQRLDEAKVLLEEIIEIIEESGDNYRLALALSDIGKIYRKANNEEQAIKSFKKAKQLFEKMNNEKAADACELFIEDFKKE